MRALVLASAVALASAGAAADPVQIRDGALRLNGNLEVPADKALSDGLAIVLHGTQSHHRHETIAALQKDLKTRGIATLAITFSLDVDDRTGPRACDVPHAYTVADLGRELDRWQAWAAAQGVRTVDLIGFSRGGAQLAELMQEARKARRIVLLAPAFIPAASQAAGYRKVFGQELAPALDAARAAPQQTRRVDFLLCREADVTGLAFLDAYREMPVSSAATITQPTLVVIAADDEIVPDLAQRLPARVRRVIVDGSDHFFRDLNSEDAADAIAAFLRDP